MSNKARVFISCEQKKESEEVTIANQIEQSLRSMGFDPYVAVQEHTLQGVKETIFKKLANAEYFLFVDFKREKLYTANSEDTRECRGSLFSHQELAIATFLEHESLAFQEEGLKRDDGILRFIQANCIPFSDRKQLPSLIAEKIKEKQ
jgi:hypothetical protein